MNRAIFASEEVIDHDLDEILADYKAAQAGKLKDSEYRFTVKRSQIIEPLIINLQYHLPNLNKTIKASQERAPENVR